MAKTIIINNVTYTIIKKKRFKTSYGWAGSKGIEVFYEPNHNTSQTSDRYSSMKEFRATLRRRLKK